MTIGEAYQQLSSSLRTIYEPREATAIADLILENISGFTKSSRLVHKNEELPENQQSEFFRMQSELMKHKPLQYVLHEAYFYGMKLYVDENVLIPRPETEELADWILKEEKTDSSRAFLDIGTGSGCLAIAIKKHMEKAVVSAVDVSEKALQIAQKNAALQSVNISFFQADILKKEEWKAFPLFDCIVSNPPYIAKDEAKDMGENVLYFEPHLALFVDNENPLLFYDAISSFGLLHLNQNGKLFFEINETFGNEVVQLLLHKGYTDVEKRKDMQGKDRMIKAVRSL